MSRVGLITVVSGERYEWYAEDLHESAREYFLPDHDTWAIILPGQDGWPDATLYRYHVILDYQDKLKEYDYLFLCDADMRFESVVGDEILGTTVATIHPGYVTTAKERLPYERNSASRAFVSFVHGGRYYAGGFFGGERSRFLMLAAVIADGIDVDDRNGVLAVWHDESHLNKVLSLWRPDVELSPAYCYPDNDKWYVTQWPESYERKLVALDKTPAERVGR